MVFYTILALNDNFRLLVVYAGFLFLSGVMNWFWLLYLNLYGVFGSRVANCWWIRHYSSPAFCLEKPFSSKRDTQMVSNCKVSLMSSVEDK